MFFRTIAVFLTLTGAGIARLTVYDRDSVAVQNTLEMAPRLASGLVQAGPPVLADHDMVINATPLGLKPGDAFPVDLAQMSRAVLVADIAALDRQTALLRHARALGCATSDGNDMLTAQIRLIAGFAAGLSAGTPLGSPQAFGP